MTPGDVNTYFIKIVKTNCLFTSSTAYFSSLEKGFKNFKKDIRSYKNFTFQSGSIKPVDNFKYISQMVLILRYIIYDSELWLCENTNQLKEEKIYKNDCRNVINEVRLVSRQTTIRNDRKPKVRNSVKLHQSRVEKIFK
jgi:hypothetical protein